jgi:Rrf2 family protein
MVELALHPPGEAIQCRDIASRQEIPEPYLNQLLSAMRRARLVASRRGPGGGHQLAMAPAEITLADIVAALERPDEGASGGRGADTSCACALREVWSDVGKRAQTAMGELTLAELSNRVRDRAGSYSI